jgi:ADP-ribosyl-[dinitrogen reductase] hydrolase
MRKETSSLVPVAARVRGAIYGSAVGDALGAGAEFLSPREVAARFGRVTDLAASTSWAEGEWTDDTELTLFTAAAYAGGEFAPAETARRMVRWMRAGPKDIGNTTAAALRPIADGAATWENAGRLALRAGRASPANGSLMRAAPTGLVRRPDDPRLAAESLALSGITHADPRCLASCVAFNVVLSHLVHRPTDPLGVALAAARDAAAPIEAETADLVEGVRVERPLRHAAEDRYDASRMGFVLLCLERALAALRDASDYETSVLRVVNLGGDADTNAAVAGALLGARFGIAGIPDRWTGRLLRTDEIEEALAVLVPLAAAVE